MKSVKLSLNLSWSNFGDISKEIQAEWSDEDKKTALRKRSLEMREKLEHP